jgi:hypothetical protein
VHQRFYQEYNYIERFALVSLAISVNLKSHGGHVALIRSRYLLNIVCILFLQLCHLLKDYKFLNALVVSICS